MGALTLEERRRVFLARQQKIREDAARLSAPVASPPRSTSSETRPGRAAPGRRWQSKLVDDVIMNAASVSRRVPDRRFRLTGGDSRSNPEKPGASLSRRKSCRGSGL